MDGLHSPFGLFGQIKEKRGLTHDELLWGQPWIMYLLELQDAPRYVNKKLPAPVAESAEDINRILGKAVSVLRRGSATGER